MLMDMQKSVYYKYWLYNYFLSGEDNSQSMDHDLEIKSKRDIFNIKKIKFATFGHLIDIFGIAKLYRAQLVISGLSKYL